MEGNTKETLQKVLDHLEEISFWLRFQGRSKLRELLLAELNTDAKRIVYQMTDGERSRRRIASFAKVSDDNVQKWWERWYQLGVLTTSEKFKGRPKRVVSLEEIGIRVPRLKSVATKSATSSGDEDKQW